VSAEFVGRYHAERYHESLDNLTLEDVYTGRGPSILDRRKRIKQETINERQFDRQKAA
jgi:putative transposase